MTKLLTHLRTHWPVVTLVLISLLLFLTNFTSGAFLIGWDNIMPELNIGLNLQRAIFGVWQTYRGLGVDNSLPDNANLLHTIYIAILMLFTPQSAVRDVYIHLTHLLGGLGMYYLVYYWLKNKKASFIGALFYMFNIGTIQMYFAPLEVFATHFAALPWLTLSLFKTLHTPTKRNLLIFFLLSLAFCQQGFVPTIFIVYVVLTFFILLFHILQTKRFKTALIVCLTIFCANAFWLLPFLYSGTHNAGTIQHTKINEFASEEIFYRNQAKGDLLDVLELKGFMIDTVEYDNSKNMDVLFMNIWRNHSSSLLYQIVYVAFLILLITGIVTALRTKNRFSYPFLATAIFCFIFLANNTPLFAQLTELIRTLSPTLGEIFRFPFTKFITLFAFCLSIFVGLGYIYVETYIAQHAKRFSHPKAKLISPLTSCLLPFSLLFLAYPAFLGNFTSPLLRNKLPQDYLQAFSYFSTQLSPTGRTVLLPMYTFWNWQYRGWGQRGSGFYWYAMPQPTTERAFDPWSLENEQLYNEISYAINAQDKALFLASLKKYDVQYLFLDQYILSTLTQQPINYDSLKKFLASCSFIHRDQTFGRIVIYSTTIPDATITQLPAHTTTVGPAYQVTEKDMLSTNYINSTATADTIPLFPSLYSAKLQSDLPLTVHETSTQIILDSKLTYPQPQKNSLISLPSLFAHDFLIPATFNFANSHLIITPIYPHVLINNQEVPMSVAQLSYPLSLPFQPTTLTLEETKQTIKLSSTQPDGYLLNGTINTLTFSDGKTSQTITLSLKNIHQPATTYTYPFGNIQSVSVVIDKIPSPLDVTNVISDKAYELRKPDLQFPSVEDTNAISNIVENKNNVSFSVKGKAVDFTFYQPNLYHQGSYILFADNQYTTGLPMNFYIDNPFEARPELETRLAKKSETNTIIIPPTENYYSGYGFHFIEKSVGGELASSTLSNIHLYPLPAETIRNMTIYTPQTISVANKQPLPYFKLNEGAYQLTTNTQSGYVVLSQAYDPGWQAYEFANGKWPMANSLGQVVPFLFGKPLNEHVLVNNWANGWALPATTYQLPATIFLIYWPQYLEDIGLGLVLINLLVLLFFPLKKIITAKDC